MQLHHTDKIMIKTKTTRQVDNTAMKTEQTTQAQLVRGETMLMRPEGHQASETLIMTWTELLTIVQTDIKEE